MKGMEIFFFLANKCLGLNLFSGESQIVLERIKKSL